MWFVGDVFVGGGQEIKGELFFFRSTVSALFYVRPL
jgi:hypothetical protein